MALMEARTLSSRRSSTWLPKRLRPWNSQWSITGSRWRA
jgi:hypothetical protein